MGNRRVPVGWTQPVTGKKLRLKEALLRLQVFEVEPAVIAHPGRIDGIVFARGLPVDDVFAGANDGVATRRAACAEAFRFFQKPDPHLEPEIGRSEGADWADV